MWKLGLISLRAGMLEMLRTYLRSFMCLNGKRFTLSMRLGNYSAVVR